MQVLPVLVLFIPIGIIVDRFDRRRLAMVAALGTGVVGLGLTCASVLAAPVWVYFALLVGQGCVSAIHSPATSALLANIGPQEVLRANRLLSSVSETAQISAPGFAGLSLTLVAPHIVGATAVIASLCYRLLPTPLRREIGHSDWREGFCFVFRSPLLLSALTLDMFAIVFAGVVCCPRAPRISCKPARWSTASSARVSRPVRWRWRWRLLVAGFHRGNSRVVCCSSWSRSTGSPPSGSGCRPGCL
jgi:MFS family permease